VTIDTAAPPVVVSAPAAGASYLLNEMAIASYSCVDSGSTIGLCEGPVANGAAIATSNLGGASFTVQATDTAGNTASTVHSYDVISISDGVSNLAQTVEDMNLQQGAENSLDAKLQHIHDALTAANSGRRADAVNKLQAFINEVQAQLKGSRLTQAQADVLIAAASRMLAVLGG
jgi:hypothetical protein